MKLNTTLRIQAHWLVAQKANARPKPAKELAHTNARHMARYIHKNSLKAEIILSLLVTQISLGVYYYLFDLADSRIVFMYERMNLKEDSPLTMGR